MEKTHSVELDEHEIDFITDLLASSISSFQKIKEINDIIGKVTKKEFIESAEFQKNLFNKLIKFIEEERLNYLKLKREVFNASLFLYFSFT